MIGSRYQKHAKLAFEQRIDPASTALVVIDVQNDFALPGGVCGQVGDDVSPVAPVIERLKALIAAARRASVVIVFVRTTYDEVVLSPTLAEQYLRRGYLNSICRSGTLGVEFYNGIGPRDSPNEFLVTKHRYSAFWGSPIDLVLRNNGIRTLVLTGIATEVCVESTARDAFFRDYQVVVPADCVGSYSEERQKASLAVLARSFGIVTSSIDIAATWQRLGSRDRNWRPERRAERQLKTLESRVNSEYTAILLLLGHRQKPEANIDVAVRRLIDSGRRAGCLIIHAQPAPSEKESGAPRFAVSPHRDEQIVLYHRTSAFADTQLDVLLRSNCIRTIVFAGGETNIAVESTVREAADRDYYAVVAEDCVCAAASEQDLHASSLASMRRHFAMVASSDAIQSCWTRLGPLGQERRE